MGKRRVSASSHIDAVRRAMNRKRKARRGILRGVVSLSLETNGTELQMNSKPSVHTLGHNSFVATFGNTSINELRRKRPHTMRDL